MTENSGNNEVREPLVPAEDIAKEHGVTLATVLNWKNLGCPAVPMGGRQFFFSKSKVKEFLTKHPTYGKSGRPPTTLEGRPVAELMAEVKIRKEQALAERHELNLAKLKGEVVPIEYVREERLKRIAVARANLLALPGKLAGRLANRTEKDIYKELELAVREVLQEFANAKAESHSVVTETELSTKLEDVA